MHGELDSESINKIWAGDHLERRKDAQSIIQFLPARLGERERQGRTKSYVLNLNSKWGSGKTFFLERLGKQLEHQGYLHVYINAWTDDHSESPMVSVMAGIQKALDPFTIKERIGKWVAREFSNEFSAMSSHIQNRGRIESLLTQYPQLVRTAAQFTLQLNVDEN